MGWVCLGRREGFIKEYVCMVDMDAIFHSLGHVDFWHNNCFFKYINNDDYYYYYLTIIYLRLVSSCWLFPCR